LHVGAAGLDRVQVANGGPFISGVRRIALE